MRREERPVTVMSVQLWRSDSSDADQQGSNEAVQPEASSSGSAQGEQQTERMGETVSSSDASTSGSQGETTGRRRDLKDGGGRGFSEGGTVIGPHRPRQDVYFRVR